MANRWTEKQLKAIRTNGCNILVAAAAGSGKTAVLVERIIRKITAEDGTDVDRMVVVTFTKAAAAEMKQRIREALDAMLQENPGNERLIRQMTLIHNAPITTIDSFCLNIVRNYFTDIELDPGFRIADEGEMKLLENDVMEEMLEEYYASENQVFFDFVDAYGTGRDDTKIVDIILKLYRFARSYPWPEEWFKDCLCIYRQADIDTAEQNAAIGYLFDTVRRRFKDYDRQYEKLESICNEPDGPLMYAAAVQSDNAGIRQILDEMIYNITENAVKYNKENGNVTIWVGNTLEGPKVRVSDTGIGIPKEHQDRIFERFYRVDKSHSKERGGTGLGLSIVKHGAILHGAKVQVDSEYGKGTRMEIIFPEK